MNGALRGVVSIRSSSFSLVAISLSVWVMLSGSLVLAFLYDFATFLSSRFW